MLRRMRHLVEQAECFSWTECMHELENQATLGLMKRKQLMVARALPEDDEGSDDGGNNVGQIDGVKEMVGKAKNGEKL